jgi:hypoxanthine phosphoribosyltransferase
MEREVAKLGDILLTADQIAARVRQLGEELARAYAGREPVLVAIMNGCVLFVADLMRAWPGVVDVEFAWAESYDGTEAGHVRLALPEDLARRVAGRPVLVVDDIYDTGRTLTEVCRAIDALGPAEVRTVVLLRKRRRGPSPAADAPPLRKADWVGFEIPDRFVVGYGLDYRGRYRNLPHMAALRQDDGSR